MGKGNKIFIFRHLVAVLILSFTFSINSGLGQNTFLQRTSFSLTFEPNIYPLLIIDFPKYTEPQEGYSSVRTDLYSYLFHSSIGQYKAPNQLHTRFSTGLRVSWAWKSRFVLNPGILYLHEYYPLWYDNSMPHWTHTYDLQEYFASYIRLPLGISWIFRPYSKAKRSLGLAFNFDFLMQDKVNYAFAPSSGLHTKSYPLILDRIVPELSYSRSWHLYKDMNLKFQPGVCLLPVFQKAHHEFVMTNISLCWRIMLEYKPNDSKK